MILKRNGEIISRNGTFGGLRADLRWLLFDESVISWISTVQNSMPGTASVYEYRTSDGDLWELR